MQPLEAKESQSRDPSVFSLVLKVVWISVPYLFLYSNCTGAVLLL